MKSLLISCLSISCGLMSLSISSLGAPEVEPSNPAGGREKWDHLVRAFNQTQPEATRDFMARRIAKLEALQTELSQQNRETEAALAKTLASAREVYARLDQPNLRRALINSTWIWRSNRDTNAVVTVFHADGTTAHIAMQGRWRISGPNEVTISTEGDGDYILKFKPSLKGFEGDRDGILGNAVQMPIDTLCANVWTLRDDKLEFHRDGRFVQLGHGWEGQDWRFSKDESEVTIRFTNGNGGTFKFEDGVLTHFDGAPFERSRRE